MSNACIGQIIKMGADAPIPPNTMNAAASDAGHTPGGFNEKMINLLVPRCLGEALIRGTLTFILVPYLTHTKCRRALKIW